MITIPLYTTVFDLPETLMLSNVSFLLVCMVLFSGRKQISNYKYMHKLQLIVEIERDEYFVEYFMNISWWSGDFPAS